MAPQVRAHGRQGGQSAHFRANLLRSTKRGGALSHARAPTVPMPCLALVVVAALALSARSAAAAAADSADAPRAAAATPELDLRPLEPRAERPRLRLAALQGGTIAAGLLALAAASDIGRAADGVTGCRWCDPGTLDGWGATRWCGRTASSPPRRRTSC